MHVYTIGSTETDTFDAYTIEPNSCEASYELRVSVGTTDGDTTFTMDSATRTISIQSTTVADDHKTFTI